MNREALIFVHIPKTAGTTLNRIIEWQYNPLSIFTIDPHRIRATVARFKTFSEERRRRFRVIRGHLPFGIHEYLPQGGTYITMLRDPIKRLLSSYYFILRWPLHPLHRKFKKEKLSIEDLVEFQPHRHNLQCRFISGLGNVGECNEQTLEIAKENLARRFRVVGISERFEESLFLMIALFGWNVSYYESRKVAKDRPSLDADLVRKLSERNHLDLELYAFGKKLFEESLQKHEDSIRETRRSMAEKSKAGVFSKLGFSSIGYSRFLISKAISAL